MNIQSAAVRLAALALFLLGARSAAAQGVNANVNNTFSFMTCLQQVKAANNNSLTKVAHTVQCVPNGCKLELVKSTSAQEYGQTPADAGSCDMPRVIFKCGPAEHLFIPTYGLNAGVTDVAGRFASPRSVEFGTQLRYPDPNNPGRDLPVKDEDGAHLLELGENKIPPGGWSFPAPFSGILANTAAVSCNACHRPHAVSAPDPVPNPPVTSGSYMGPQDVEAQDILNAKLEDICKCLKQNEKKIGDKYDARNAGITASVIELCDALVQYETNNAGEAANGNGCNGDDDCQSDHCAANVCQPATCSDGTSNGSETDVDCGGPSCPSCVPFRHCGADSDCQSGFCTAGTCALPAACRNGVIDQDETDVDCGGSVCGPCDPAQGCQIPSDCRTAVCVFEHCASATCTDFVRNGSETAVDCGGLTCSPCADGERCDVDQDCQSSFCGATGRVCAPASCRNGVMDGAETDVDCGGPVCGACPPGLACVSASDCGSHQCVANQCTAPRCNDGIQNGGETAVDCGGTACGGCAVGQHCNGGFDCASSYCQSNACQANPAVKEASPAQNMRASRGTGSRISFTYTAACGATDHAVYWGVGRPIGAVSWSQAACGLGTTGSAIFDPGTPSAGSMLYFAVVGQNSGAEGSYGRNKSGAERPEAPVGIGACERPQVLGGTCP